MKILLRIPLTPYSGYGNDGIGMTRALMRAGADVYIDPTTVQGPLPADIALLFTKELVAPFDLAIVHVDPMTMEASEERAAAATFTIGWTMWEYTNLLNAEGQEKFRKQYEHFDALVAYDEVTAGCLRDHYDGPILVHQGGYEPEQWTAVDRDWEAEDFYFAMIGVLSPRKDPFVSIQAFVEAQAEDEEFAQHARLSLKTSVPGLHSKMQDVYPNLRIFYDVWPTSTVQKFYEAQHVLLCPSRGEGKNLPALEFMTTGGTVIATDWGGHQQWLSDEYAYPLDYRLAPVEGYPNTLNARADVQHLKALLLHTFRNRAEVKAKGDLAREAIPAKHNWDHVMLMLMYKLDVSLYRQYESVRHGNG
jgi:glycosyltransferase involved in cell wall biosynthesis